MSPPTMAAEILRKARERRDKALGAATLQAVATDTQLTDPVETQRTGPFFLW